MDKQIDEVVELVQRKVDQAFKRGKELGIAMASALCMFCEKKTNECTCGHKEITKRMIEEYVSETLKDADDNCPVALEFRAIFQGCIDWLEGRE